MWRSSPINPTKYRIVRRFDIIVAIARILRGCHFFYVNAQDHCLYGIPEEGFCIRTIEIPQTIEIVDSFIFRVDTLDIDVINNYIDFIILDDIPWAAIPMIHLGDVHRYQSKWKPVSNLKLWTVGNDRGEVDHLDLLAPDTDKAVMLPQIRANLNRYIETRQCMRPSIQFPHMERHPVIQEIYTNKVSIGEKFVPLYYDDKGYGVLIFRGLFPLNKADELTIYVNDRTDQPGIFEAHFEVTHKTNPIKYILEDGFTETTHIAAVRLN